MVMVMALISICQNGSCCVMLWFWPANLILLFYIGLQIIGEEKCALVTTPIHLLRHRRVLHHHHHHNIINILSLSLPRSLINCQNVGSFFMLRSIKEEEDEENAIVFALFQRPAEREERWSRHIVSCRLCCPWPLATCWHLCQGAPYYCSLSLSLSSTLRWTRRVHASGFKRNKRLQHTRYSSSHQ